MPAPLRAVRIPKVGMTLGRRARVRFPLVLPVEYTLAGRKYTGATANMSSAGILIATQAIAPVNKQIKLSIDWPAMLYGSRLLRLVVFGTVRRVDRHGMALAIERHEFRLKASPGGVPPAR